MQRANQFLLQAQQYCLLKLTGLILFCSIEHLVRAQFCPNGGTVYTQPFNNYSPQTCSPTTSYYSTNSGDSYYGTTSSNGCPNGYSCLAFPSSTYTSGSSYSSGQYFCCSSTSSSPSGDPGNVFNPASSTAFCPSNSRLWSQANGNMGNALTCQEVGAFCQTGYTCQQAPYSSGLFCCSTGSLYGTGVTFCPYGSQPLYQGTGAQICSSYAYASPCPVGYSCYLGSSGYDTGTRHYGTTGYCCSVAYGKRKRRQSGYGTNYNSIGYGTK
uniref:Uncharacterized protein n=1 Tax=Plectus sambesii TaxID=2011161 RepID=A0A914VIT0_9BILA